MKIAFSLNGSQVEVEAPANITLLHLLREYLGLTGPKPGCEIGECGACAVLLDGQVVNSCQLLAPQAAGRVVTTIEGIRDADGGPNDLQLAFQEFGAVQCGYCTPGMIMAAEALPGPRTRIPLARRSGRGFLAPCAAALATSRSSTPWRLPRAPTAGPMLGGDNDRLSDYVGRPADGCRWPGQDDGQDQICGRYPVARHALRQSAAQPGAPCQNRALECRARL